MDWKVIALILLIPLAVLILATIFRLPGEDSQEQEKGVADRSEGGPSPRRPRRQESELDRILAEAGQLSTASRAQREQPATLVWDEIVPVTMPFREEPRPVEEVRPAPALPVALPVFVMPAMEQSLVRIPEPQPDAPPPPLPVVQSLSVPGSPLVARVRALLHDRAALQAAFVLHEILGPPKCQRRSGERRASR